MDASTPTTPRPDLDERVDPRIRAFLSLFVAAGGAKFPSPDLSVEDLRAIFLAMESLMFHVLKPLAGEVPVGDLLSYTITIPAEGHPDGLKLFINRPATSERVPAIVYCHGGGMAMLKAEFIEQFTGRLLAHQGLCVIMPEFRNSTVAPFPAGLEDCYAALKWVTENKDKLGITSQIIVGGESGGGNLSIATAILAKDRGLSGLRGLYSSCPFIGGSMEAQSWKDYDGYLLTKDTASMYKMYYLTPEDGKKHIAFPAFATAEQLKGLVPTVISVNEFDPLKDEGVAFYRTALAAGVRARLTIIGGTTHGGDIMYGFAPDLAVASAQAIFNFAKSL